jgi:hypothetical protein
MQFKAESIKLDAQAMTIPGDEGDFAPTSTDFVYTGASVEGVFLVTSADGVEEQPTAIMLTPGEMIAIIAIAEAAAARQRKCLGAALGGEQEGSGS